MPIQSSPFVVIAFLALTVPIKLHAQDAVLPHGATPPDWLVKPSAASVQAYYPELANDLDMPGFARISCRVSAAGRVEHCRVADESPPGLGFGQAALRMAPLFRFRPAATLVTAVPSQVVIPVRFVPRQDDVRRLIPFMALLAALSTLWARRARRQEGWGLMAPRPSGTDVAR